MSKEPVILDTFDVPLALQMFIVREKITGDVAIKHCCSEFIVLQGVWYHYFSVGVPKK